MVYELIYVWYATSPSGVYELHINHSNAIYTQNTIIMSLTREKMESGGSFARFPSSESGRGVDPGGWGAVPPPPNENIGGQTYIVLPPPPNNFGNLKNS